MLGGKTLEELESKREESKSHLNDAIARKAMAEKAQETARCKWIAQREKERVAQEVQNTAWNAYKRLLRNEGYVTPESLAEAKCASKDADKAFFDARADQIAAKTIYEDCRADHADAEKEAIQAERAFNEADRQCRLWHQNVRSNQNWIAYRIASIAGVPDKYRDKVQIGIDEDSGDKHIRFGGKDTPDGPGCGCYVLNRYDVVVSKHDPIHTLDAPTGVEVRERKRMVRPYAS